MKKGVLIAAVALLPLAAGAQTGVPVRPPPANAGAGGIAVLGQGSVRFAVRTLRFMAYARGNVEESSVLAAMRAAGIDDPSLGPAGPQFGPNQPVVARGTVRDLTRPKLERLGQAAADYIRAHPGTALDNVNFSAPLDQCPPHEQEARARAIADARRKAEAIASLTGIVLGAVASVNEQGGCPADQDGFSPALQLDLTTFTAAVVVNEYVTFTVLPGSGGLRRPL